MLVRVFTVVTLERDYMKSVHPDITGRDASLSKHTLPFLMTDALGTQTVFEFLTDTWNDVLQENMDELQAILLPLVDLFPDKQLSLVYERLNTLLNLFEVVIE